MPNGKNCYDFKVQNISLYRTQFDSIIQEVGVNEIRLFAVQNAIDSADKKFRVATIRAQYIDSTYKLPFSGKITLTDEDFHPIFDENNPDGYYDWDYSTHWIGDKSLEDKQ